MRSYLYVPGDAPGKLAGALARGADALIVDLEDAVAPPAKDRARAQVADWLAAVAPGRVSLWVRVNPGERREGDIRAVAGIPQLAGLCLAKTGSAAELSEVDGLLTALGSAAAVVPLLESAGAVLRAAEIARAPRVCRLQLGEADLCAELGVEPGPDQRELLYARSAVVLASAAAAIAPPVGPVSTDFRDPDGLRRSTMDLKRLGFRGRACIHPAQVAVVNEVFTPAPEEVARARELVARHRAATGGGNGAWVDPQGRLVDEAVVRAARRVIEDAGRP